MRKTHLIRWGMLLTLGAGLMTAELRAGDAPAARPPVTVAESALDGCKIKIAVPANWNGTLLLLAHGRWSEDAPLTAEMFETEEPCRSLLADGWMIAATSYRRNGWIVDEAMLDLDALQNHVAAKYGAPKRVFLYGKSMGGLIAVKMAERQPPTLAGAAANCPAMDPVRDTALLPRIPIVLVYTHNETKASFAYSSHLKPGSVPMAFRTVKRDGHCNTNGQEELAVLRDLAARVDTGKIEMLRDVTFTPLPVVSTAEFRDGRASAAVTEVATAFGNLKTAFVPADLERLGIKPGARFRLEAGDQSPTVLFGTGYGDVPKGEWVAFFDADGRFILARNFANAAAQLGCRAGDKVSLKANIEHSTSNIQH